MKSLRLRVALLIVALTLAPAIAVKVHQWFDATKAPRVQEQADEALARALAAPDLEQVAWRTGTRIRTFAPTGERLSIHDYDAHDNIGQWVGRLVFGSRDWPSVGWLDGDLESAQGLAWFSEADHRSCTETFAGELLVCRAVGTRADGTVVEVTESSREAVRALHDAQPQLLKITLFTLPFASLFGLAVGRILVAPARRLVTDIEAREGTPTHVPLDWSRPDEFGRIARAFDALAHALDTRRSEYVDTTADLAHALKSPVAALRMAGEQLADVETRTPERDKRLTDAVVRSSARLHDLVDDFLALTRAEDPRTPRTEVSLASLLEDHDQWGAFHLTGDAVLTLEARSTQRALFNLVDNALAFASEPGAVRINVAQRDDHVVLGVEDDGPGFDDPDRAFERFYTTRSGGTGLGLAIAQAAVHAHGGRIEAENTANGARVTVSWPTGM